jgi:hypothetical protein
MTYQNPLLLQAMEAYQNGVLRPEEYYNQLDLIYRANPTSFTEEEVDFLEKEFKKVELPFNRDLEAADSNLMSTVNQFVSGMVEGFTTLGWAEDPDTTAESIANKVGHLIGFAPDVVASVLSMGQYVPIATAKAISRKGAGAVTKGLQSAGQKAPTFLRKEIGTDTFVLQSIPMKIADIVSDNVKASLGKANVDTMGFLSKGLFANARVKDIGEQALHLGVAMGVSSWKDGPKAMADTAIHGAAAGALFGTIGNYVNVARLLANPKTEKVGQQIVRGVAQKAYDTETQLRGINMAMKGALGAGFQGGMATAQGLPVPEQVYEYLLGAFFGATARDRGFIDRTRYINKNFSKFGDLSKPTEQVIKELSKDKEFNALTTYDQNYVKNHINVVQQQIFDRASSLEGEAIALIRDIAKKENIDLPNITKEQFENLKKKAQEQKITEVLSKPEFEFRDDVQGPVARLQGVTKIISGMQSGADVAGLYAARKLGIATGGNVNKDFYGNLLKNPAQIAKEFNLTLTELTGLTGLTNRTTLNVQDANATILFTGGGRGSKRTINEANRLGKKIYVMPAKTEYTPQDVINLRNFIESNPGVLNIAGSRDAKYQEPIQKVLIDAISGETLNISSRGKEFDKIKKEIVNDLGLDYEGFLKTLDNKDLNEPLVMNNDLRAMADIIRGNKLGNKQDEIMVTISKLAVESAYDVPTFQRLFKETYKNKPGVEQALKEIKVNRLGSYLKIRKNIQDRKELLIDLSSDGIKIIDAPKVGLDGVPINASRAANKYNDTFKRDDNRRVRFIIRKSYVEDSIKTFGMKKRLTKSKTYKVESPLGFKGKAAEKFEDYLSSKAIETLKVELAKQDLYIYGGANDSGMLLVHRFPFTNSQLNTTQQRLILKNLGLYRGKSLTNEQAKEYVSNIYFLLAESGYIKTNETPTVDTLTKGMKEYINEPLFETVQSFNKYQNLAQGADIKQEAQDFVDHLQNNKDINLRTDGTFNFIQFKDLPSTFKVKGEASVSATDAVVYTRQDTFNVFQTKNFRPALNGFLKLVGFKAPADGVGNILLKTGTFKATDAMNKFMLDNNIHFIASESATKTKVGLKKHTLDYNATTKTWSVKEPLQMFKMKPEELYLNYGVYENYSKLDKPVLIAKQMFDKINFEQLGADAPAFRDGYRKLIQDSLRGKEADNVEFKKAMLEDNGAFEIRDLNSVSMDLINEAISEVGIRTAFGRRVLKKIIERGREDYHNQIQEQGDKLDIEAYGIETMDIPDILAKVDYDVSAITYPPVLTWINRSLANYRQMRVTKPTVEYGFDAKLGPADLEVAAGLKDNEIKFGNAVRKKIINVKDVGEMTLEQAWNTFEPMKQNPTQHKLYNNYKDALTFLIMRNPNSGNGGVRAVEFVGFSGRDGIHAVTTSKTDYYLGGADKDADSVIVYQNMPSIFKKVFNKYESELFVNGETRSFEQPEGTWKDNKLVEPYDITGNKKVSKNNKQALEDLLSTDMRINVARNAKIGKVNIETIVSSFNKMQIVADLIQQNGGVLNATHSAYSKQLKKVVETPISIKLKGNVKDLQLDNYIGVNLMADSANFVKIAKFNQIQDVFFKKYFEVTGTNIKTFSEAFKKIDALNHIRELHNVVYLGKGQDKYMLVEQMADNYLSKFGAQNHYYYELAQGMKSYKNFTINPFKYLFGDKFTGFDNVQVAKEYTLLLREKLLENKMLKRFDLSDNYRNDLEAKATLEMLIRNENYDAIHQKLIEYQSVFMGTRMIDTLVKDVTKSLSSKYSADSIEAISKEIIDTTYKIKRLYDKDQLMSITGKEKIELEVADVNKMIATLKNKLKTKFGDEPVIYDRLEEITDVWLLSTPIVGKDPTRLQEQIMLDIESQNADMIIKESAKDFSVMNNVYQIALDKKRKAIMSMQMQAPFMVKSIAIKPENRQKYFERLDIILTKNAQVIADRLTGPRNNKVEDFINEYVYGGDRTFDINTIERAIESDPDSKRYIKVTGSGDERKVEYDFSGFKKDKDAGKEPPNDTEKLTDKVFNTEKLIGKILPQFDYIANQQNTRNQAITTGAQSELKRLREILTQSPDAINRFEELFIDLTYRLEGVGRRLDTLTAKDLKIFNDSLDVLYSSKKISEKRNSFGRGPDWKDNTFNYTVPSQELQKVEKLVDEFTRPIIDKNGELSVVRIELPTSTLEMARQTIDSFDTFQKVMNPAIQNKINETFEYLDYNSQSLKSYRDLLFEAAVNKQEWNDGKYPTGSFDKVERQAIEQAWRESEKAIKELNNEGILFPLSSRGKEAITERVDADTFVERIRKDVDTLLKDIDKTFIKSRYKQLARTLISNYKVAGLSMKNDGTVIGKWKLSRTTDEGVKNMESLFLQESGIIDTKKISILYKDIDRANISKREYISKYLPSINDYRFLKFHLEVKDRVQFLLPKIDLNKKLKPSETKQVQKAVLRELYGKEGTRIDYFARFQVGDVSQGYFPRNSHASFKNEKPLLEEWQKDKVTKDVQEAREDQTKLPTQLRVDILYKRIDVETALKIYESQLMSNFERQMGNSLTAGQTKAERQIIDLMSRPNVDGFIGDYAAGPTRSRGEQFMPYYRKDLDALRRYSTGLFKMYFTNLAGLRTEILLKNFDYRNKDKEFAREWSNYIRNAATNMMGLSTYRAYNIHGIRKQDQPLFEEFIEKGLDIDNMGPRKNYELDLLRDFTHAIEVRPQEQLLILRRNKNNLVPAQKEVNELKMKRAKDLVKQVNTTGKYGSLYHYTSDEVAVAAFSRINKLFGGKIFGELPTNPRDRQYAIMSRIRNLSDLEGKFELLSLLSHPKTAITNLYGGVQNTISDTGWESFRRANDPAWMIKNIFDNGRAEFTFIGKGGRVETKKINSEKRIYEWLESLGVYDQMFLDLISLDKQYGRDNVKPLLEKFVRRMNKSYEQGKITTETIAEREANQTWREILRESKVDIPIVEFGALPMKWSERKLRGTAFLANYINMHQNVLGTKISEGIPFNSNVLVDFAMKGVTASQFMYQATFRPNFANTSLGRVLTRFQPYAWNSIGRRMKLYKDAQLSGWNRDVQASKKFQRQFTFDVFALGMANIFVASIFEYALSPPMNWLQDTSALLFGDAKERERAFFSSYPHPVLAPLQVVTPPIGRFVLSPMTAILNGDWENFSKYQLATYFPFGRLYRDAKRTYESPAMAVDFMTGLPLHKIHTLRRNQINEQRLLDTENDILDLDED